MERWFQKLKQEFNRPLPGPAAQVLMSPSSRRMPETALPPTKGSVMILLFPVHQECCTLFIKRAKYNGVHSGQISFPGGMHETIDDSRVATALRETEEEIGILRNSITVIGKLTSLHIPVSNVDVLPVVSLLKEKPECVPDPNEVEYVIEAKLSELLHPAAVKRETIRVGDHEFVAPYYDLRGHHIWGATAMMLSEFLEIVKRTGRQE
jgi:8-oxo-dGTP pyrophosphatase MutT (NUDIX family)